MRFFSRDYIPVNIHQLRTDSKMAKWAVIYIIAYFVFLKKYFYSTCPVVVLTGFPCPACGMTRAVFLLLNLEFEAAFRTQPFVYALILLIVIFSFNRYILSKKTPKWFKWMAIFCLFGMIAFYIWRMITIFPGEPPMSYYPENLSARLFRLIKLLLAQ